jgi:hypothetical protein
MVFLRSCIFAVGVFGALAIIALLVAGIMRIIFLILHRDNKKSQGDPSQAAIAGKAGQE